MNSAFIRVARGYSPGLDLTQATAILHRRPFYLKEHQKLFQFWNCHFKKVTVFSRLITL